MIIGKYQVIRELTRTTLSTVYECEHILKKTKVVVKVENQKQSQLLQREAEIYLYLKNSRVHIPALKGSGVHEDMSYMVLSQLKESLLTYEGSVPYDSFFKEIYYLHETKMVHRDIKPQNFLIGYDNQLYLIDFGLASLQSNAQRFTFIGNKRYASFVCFETKYVYGYKDDVISLIYMLLDLTFGYLPWDTDTKPRKDYLLEKYYPPHVLLDMYRICLEMEFSYPRLFECLRGGINSGQTQRKGEIGLI